MIAIAFLFIYVGMFCISLYFIIWTFPIRRSYLSELGELTDSLTSSQGLSVFSSEGSSAVHKYLDKDQSHNYLPQKQSSGHMHSLEQPEFAGKPRPLFDRYASDRMPEALNKNRISYHYSDLGILSSSRPKFQKREELAPEYKVRGSENYYPSENQDLGSSERNKMRVAVHSGRAEPAERMQSKNGSGFRMPVRNWGVSRRFPEPRDPMLPWEKRKPAES